MQSDKTLRYMSLKAAAGRLAADVMEKPLEGLDLKTN
jgi:hypothetical protein